MVVSDPATSGSQPFDPSRIETVLCDLDGVVWLAHEAIPGSVEAIEAIRRSGRRVLFATNNSRATLAEQAEKLAAIGISAVGDLVTSASAAAVLVEPGSRVLVAGGPGIHEAVLAAGADPVVNTGEELTQPVDAVVVGLHREFDFARLRIAARTILAGARFIATNTDSTYPMPDGLDPGGGAIVAAIATAAEQDPIVAGKPHAPMAEVVRRMVAPNRELDPSSIVMVGDRPETDGLFAKVLGAHYAQVRSGVILPGEPLSADVEAALDVADLASVAATLLD